MRRRIGCWLACLLLALLLAAAGTAVWVHRVLLLPGPDHAVQIDVAPGASVTAVLLQLQHRGLLPSPLAGKLYVRLMAQGRSLRFGHYRIPPQTSPAEVLERLLDGRVETVEVTIIEGSDLDTVAERFMAAGIGDHAAWQEVFGHADWVHDLAPGTTSLEGFLFPETYRFSIGTPADSAARHMVERFRQVWHEETQLAGPPHWGSLIEVLTMASLVEAETSVPDERARIAGVYFNRLHIGMLLQCDPTVIYALKKRREWQGRLLRLHLQVDHPYNTYRYPGLPPGPVSSPGRAALAAALQPEENRYLYFVASPGGGHTFSYTLREHNRAVARLRRSQR